MPQYFQRKYVLTVVALCLPVLIFLIPITWENSKSNIRDNVVLNYDWLDNPACFPPCWNKIYPGKSTLPQSVEILLRAKGVTNIGIEKFENIDLVELEWEDTQNEKGGRLFSDKTNSIVFAIQPSINCCSQFDDAIKEYGEPSHIFISVSHNHESPNAVELIYSYIIIWLDIGMEVKGGPKNDAEINGNFTINSVSFFEPGEDGLRIYEGRVVDEMVEWKGYNSRSFYLSNN